MAKIKKRREEARIAFHYTCGQKALEILKDGVIKTATARVSASEQPVVWFSLNPNWEETANKSVKVNGTWQMGDRDETRLYGFGLYRFAVSSENLIPWPGICKQIGMSREVRIGLVERGLAAGARPSEWMASLDPVAVSGCELQIEGINPLTGEFGWMNCSRGQAFSSIEEYRKKLATS